jgi:hypothetical protein
LEVKKMSKVENKAVVCTGYRYYIMDVSDAITFVNILTNAEFYLEKWRKEEEGGTTYHVWDRDAESNEDIPNIRIIPLSKYHMYKLAGKPESK